MAQISTTLLRIRSIKKEEIARYMNGPGSSSQIRAVTARPVRAWTLISQVFLECKGYDTASILFPIFVC